MPVEVSMSVYGFIKRVAANMLLKRLALIGLVSSLIVLVLLLLAQLTRTYGLVAYTDPYLFRDDKVSVYEARFSDLRPLLADHDTVGFITDSSETQHLEEYTLTQYVIAPTILIDSTDCCELVIGHFLDPNYDGYTELDYLRIVQRFPDNVILFEYIGD
jgi:hypothetical protein